jgi:hypothetical protein
MTFNAQARERGGIGRGLEVDMRETRLNMIGRTAGVAMDSQDG